MSCQKLSAKFQTEHSGGVSIPVRRHAISPAPTGGGSRCIYLMSNCGAFDLSLDGTEFEGLIRSDHLHGSNGAIPQTEEQFIEQYPGNLKGMSQYACTLLVYSPADNLIFAFGETSAWLWKQVEKRNLQVLGVLYAGDDRNVAIRMADYLNRQNRQKYHTTLQDSRLVSLV